MFPCPRFFATLRMTERGSGWAGVVSEQGLGSRVWMSGYTQGESQYGAALL